MVSFWRRAIRRVSGFTLATAISGLAAVVTVPIVVAHAGAEGWAAIALGQATGAFAGIIVGMGWVLVGPGEVAGLDDTRARAVYNDSIVLRTCALLIVLPLTMWIASALSPAQQVAAALSAAATTTVSCGASWYFIGRRSPMTLILTDAVPKATFLFGGSVALVFGAPLTVFAAAQLAGSVITVLLGSLIALGWSRPRPRRTFVRIGSILRAQSHGLVAAVSSSVFISVPTMVVSAMVPGQLPQFALADRIEKLANMGLMPVTQSLQGWVGAGGDLHQRAGRATRASLLLGLGAGGVFATLGPWIAALLSKGQIAIDWQLTLPFGIVLFCTTLSQTLGAAVLVPLSRSDVLMKSSLLGALSCALAMIVAIPSYGAVGAAWSVVLGEGLLLCYQVIVLRRLRRGGWE